MCLRIIFHEGFRRLYEMSFRHSISLELDDMVQEVVGLNYSELKDSIIKARIELPYFVPKGYSLGVRNGFFSDYVITGTLPLKFRIDEGYGKMIEGLLAHELSHIVLGHTNLHSLYMEGLKDLFTLGKSAVLREKQADEDVVQRGLGPHLYQVKRFFEGFISNTNAVGNINGYTSSELAKLIE
jgi:hypothetical protein